MRVLQVIASVAPRYGGPSAAVVEMCAGLAELGHDVELYTTNVDGPARLPVSLGVPVRELGFTTTYFDVKAPRGFATSWPLAAALRRELPTFDVVHVHSLYRFHGAVACALSRRFGVPYLLRPHGTLDPYHRRTRARVKWVYSRLIEQRNLDRAAAVHCTTELEREHVLSYGVAGPTVVVPLPVDIDQFETSDPEPFLACWPQLRDRRLVTFVGRLTPKKRIDLLVDGFAKARLSFPDTELVIAGPDEGVQVDLSRQASSLGVQDAVHFVGHVHGTMKTSLLSASAVFALPSEDENFGHAAVEAMASGVPVILSTRVGIEDVVASTGSGMVVGLSADEVAAAIERLLGDDRAAREMGARGRRLAREMFSRRAVARSLERTYESVVAGRVEG